MRKRIAGQTLFDAWILTFYNMIFTAFPILLYGMWDKDVSEEFLLKFPKLYNRSQRNKEFNIKNLLIWLLSAIAHATIIFFLSIYIFDSEVLWTGQTFGIWYLGCAISTIEIFVVNLKISLITNVWTVYHLVVYLGSLLSYFVFLSVYCLFYQIDENRFYWIIYVQVQSPLMWLTILLLATACILPDFAIKAFLALFHPEDWQIVAEQKKYLAKIRVQRKKEGTVEPFLDYQSINPTRRNTKYETFGFGF